MLGLTTFLLGFFGKVTQVLFEALYVILIGVWILQERFHASGSGQQETSNPFFVEAF